MIIVLSSLSIYFLHQPVQCIKIGRGLDSSWSPQDRSNARPGSAGAVDVHIVELRLVPGLDLIFSATLWPGIDPVAIQSSEDGFEAALLGLEAALEDLDHISMGRRVLECM